jgi:hypothetical protein
MLSLFLQEASVSSAPYFFGYMGAAFALVFASALPVSQRRTAERGAATGTQGSRMLRGGARTRSGHQRAMALLHAKWLCWEYSLPCACL